MTASRKALIVVAALIAFALGLPFTGAVPTASAQTISVTAADPPTGEQGTLNLPVTIKGKGFKNGAQAKFYKTGSSDPSFINVKSTKFVSSTELLATIDIADSEYALGGFDIEVAVGGRTGKGTELFRVMEKKVEPPPPIDPCTLPEPEPTTSPYVSDVPGYPGYLDSSFGEATTGKSLGPHISIKSLAIDSASRIIAVGELNDPCSTGTFGWTLARYLPDGTLDSAFGTNGLVTLTFGGAAEAYGVVLQPVVDETGRLVEENIVVVGTAKSATGSRNALPTVVRLDDNGVLDTRFGSDRSGIVVFSLSGKSPSGRLSTVTVQPNGKIVASGYAGTTSSAAGLFVIRLNVDGTRDLTFNGTGQYLDAGLRAWSYGLVTHRVQGEQEDRIVVAGTTQLVFGGPSDAILWGLLANGQRDPTFGTSGMVITPFYGFDNGYQALAMSAGRLLAVGYAYTTTHYSGSAQLALTQYDLSGNLDLSFGSGGRALTSAGEAQVQGTAIAIQSDGAIVVAGYSNNWDSAGKLVDPLTGLWRFTARGDLDTSFGPTATGWVPDGIASGATSAYWRGMVLQRDGKIVCGGYIGTQAGAGSTAALGRFWQ